MKLLTIDDHALFRQGLKFLLKDLQSDLDFLEAESLAEALALDDKASIEIILLDHHLRDSEGDESLEKISAAFENATIVVLSGEEDPQLIRRLIDHGAAGYIPKSSTQDILIAALKLILAGGVYIPAIAVHATAHADTQQENPEQALDSLSKRQLEVLMRAVQGKITDLTGVRAFAVMRQGLGGGIRKLDDVRRMLNAGADKVAINTAAVFQPEFVQQATERFGSQCIVVAIDAKQVSSEGEPLKWEIFTHGGRKPTGLDAVAWARRMADYGAGEILLTSMDRDGTKIGFDLALTRAICQAVPIPVIASGGVGNLQHLVDGVIEGGADAVLAASIFHFAEYSIGEAKRYMASRGIEVRL